MLYVSDIQNEGMSFDQSLQWLAVGWFPDWLLGLT